MKLAVYTVLAALVQQAGAAFLRARTPGTAALQTYGEGVLRNDTALIQGKGGRGGRGGRDAGTQLAVSEEAMEAMIMDMLNKKVSVRSVMKHIDERMDIDEAMSRLQGRLPQDVAALVGTKSRSQSDKADQSQSQDPSRTAAFTVLKNEGTVYMIPKEAWALNWTINVTGTTPHADQWAINFVTGSPPDMNNIAFHYNPRPASNLVVRNARLGGQWGPEERGGGFPTAFGANTHVEVRVHHSNESFQVYIAGKRAPEFDFKIRAQKQVTAVQVSLVNPRVELLDWELPGKLNEDSLQKARKILNDMMEASYKEMDDTTIECQAFKDSNRRTFDQVVTDIARVGSEGANLDKVIASALSCVAEQDVAFKSVKETQDKEKSAYLKHKSENEYLLRMKRNDLAVFDFIMEATKCPADHGGKALLLAQSGSNLTTSDGGVAQVCDTEDGGFEIHFDDPKVEAQVLGMMTDDAKLALREALGLAMVTQPEPQVEDAAPVAHSQSSESDSDSDSSMNFLQVPQPGVGVMQGLTGNQVLMSMAHGANSSYNPNIPYQCHRYENNQNDDWCRRAGTIGNTEYKFVGTSGGCGSCWCCKRPRVCTVTVYEHDHFQGWSAAYGEGYYQGWTQGTPFISKGARNDQVSSIKVDGPCVAIIFEHDLWNGWAATFPEGTYDLRAMESRGARNDQTSSLVVFPEGYVAAQKACQAQYGQCLLGQCGYYYYFYDKNALSCNCNKAVGQSEFVFKNLGYTKVGDDYGGGGEDTMGVQLFRREKVLTGCQAGVWKHRDSLVVTTTPPPAPTPRPAPVVKAPPKRQQFKRCAPIKDDAGTCGLLHDTMSLQWGKFKDEVDMLEATMHKNQDVWNKLSEDLLEQLRLVTGTKAGCQAKFSESTSAKNVLVEEGKEKEIQRKTLMKEYDNRMKECKTRIEELLFTDVCAVRTVRNKLMEQSLLTPPEEITDCEVDDWVAGECSRPCDNSCPHMIGREIDPFKCGGTQKLQRNAIVANNANGIRCPPLARTMRCAQYKCAVDCKLSQWSGWSKCSKECEGGVQTQTRSVLAKPQFGGSACASSVESRACNTMSCDRDCSLSDWTKWSPCSMACNPGGNSGTQERVRKVLVPIRGEGKCPKHDNPKRFERRKCNEQSCRGDEVCVAQQDLIIAIDGSGSVRETGFGILKAFALKLIERYQTKYLGAPAVRIGIILFGNGAKGGSGGSIAPAINIIGLTDDFHAVAAKIKTLQWQKGFTNMAQAFVLADTMFTERGRGGAAQSAVLMISDGRYSFAFETDNAVKKLKEKNTMIYMAPVSSQPGKWEAKIKHWASKPWRTNYQLIPGLAALESNTGYFISELIARFCPLSISPSGQEGKDEAKGFMIIRKDGQPNKDCAKHYDLGFVNRPTDCMVKVVTDMGLKAFSISRKLKQGRKCFGEDMKFTKTNYTVWKSHKTDIPCPNGAWERNDMYDTYAIEPLTEDASGGNMTVH